MTAKDQMTRTLPSDTAGFLILLGILLWGLLAGVAEARAQAAESSPAPDAAKDASRLLENALESERSELARMERGLERWEAVRAEIVSEIESYQIQNAAHGNLLIVLETRAEDLQTALNNKRLAIKSLSGRIAEFRLFGEGAAGRMAQLRERIAIAQKQLMDLQQERPLEGDRRELLRQFQNLLALMREAEQRGRPFWRASKRCCSG